MIVIAIGHPAHGEAQPQFTDEDQPVGWASIGEGTTGGQGGQVVTVQDAALFLRHVKGDGPLIVQIAGTLRLPEVARVGSNKTILGLGSDGVITGRGLNLRGVHNVIIRNVTIRGAAPDAINIEDGSHHIWIDHCDLSECGDGLIDIKRGSDLVTVSWNHFHDHHKTCLLGHSDKPAALQGDQGKLRVTYHHNYFDGTGSRHPRVRVASLVHVFNNYFRDNDHGVASTMDAGLLVEGNYFEGVKHPLHTQYGASRQAGRLVERNNVYVESGPPTNRGSVAEPKQFYDYQLDATQNIPKIVPARAGVGKL